MKSDRQRLKLSTARRKASVRPESGKLIAPHNSIGLTKLLLPGKASAVFLIVIFAVCSACRRPGDLKDVQTKSDQPMNAYVLGEVVCFDQNGSSDLYKEGGWGATEEDFTWTNGTSANLAFTLPRTTQPLKLRMRLKGYLNSTLQPVGVYVNNEKIADWQVMDLEDYFAIIPPAISDHVQLLIELRIPKAISPKFLGLGSDPRMLGVCCFELAITEDR